MKKTLGFKNEGSALPLVMVAVILLLTLGTGLLSVGLHGRIFSIWDASEITARSAADAGLTQALFAMNQQILVSPWNDTVLPSAQQIGLTNCDAAYSYTVTKDPTSGDYVITSIGKSRNASKMVRVTLKLKGLFDHAILTKDSLILKSNTIIDGYNSNNPADKDVDVKIGTQSTSNSKIVLNNSVVVDGDVLVGRGGDPQTVIKDHGATVTGDKRAASLRESLPKITAPALPNKGTSISENKGKIVTITPSDNGTYQKIDLQKGTLAVSGGDVVLHITGNIELGNSCEIIVKEGATLTLYIDGNIVSNNGSGIGTETPPEEAATIKLYATGTGEQTLNVKAKSDWTGVIYAPNSNVTLYAKGDAYGSVIANSFEFKNGGNFHYDEALREVAIGDQGTRFAVARWHEMPVNNASLDIQSLLSQ